MIQLQKDQEKIMCYYNNAYHISLEMGHQYLLKTAYFVQVF